MNSFENVGDHAHGVFHVLNLVPILRILVCHHEVLENASGGSCSPGSMHGYMGCRGLRGGGGGEGEGEVGMP